nr:hypothetical protein [Tanacetum cinerariifolium]
MSSMEIEQIIAQRVTNAIEANTIYEARTHMTRDLMDQVARQGEKVVKDVNNKRSRKLALLGQITREKDGHHEKDCRVRASATSYNSKLAITCYGCGEQGHYKNSTETSDELAAIQAQLNNLGREIKKVNEKVYAIQVGCKQCKGPYYTKYCPLKEGKTIEEAYYTQFGIGKFVFPVDLIILDMPQDVKVPLILERPFLSTAQAKINVFKIKITLRVRDEKIIFKSMKPTSSLIKRVYMLGLRERMELDLKARLMGETLVLKRSLDHLYRDYIKLNDLNVPLELKRYQVDDLMPTIEEGEVIDEHMIDIIKTRNNVSEYVKNMDGYRDQYIGDVIIGEPLCKASCVEAKRFDGIITIHNGINNLTYQMARSHPRFKHQSNAQCNKIKTLLKVSVRDKLNGISHPYQSSKVSSRKS